MPIIHNSGVRCLSDKEFHELDRLVMKCAYASQNAFGRLCDEAVYENDLAARLRSEGVSEVETQVPVAVSFRGFEKIYRLDLVVNGMLYELKATDRISKAHESQTFHYAALVETGLVKLINFGGQKVEGRLKGCPFGRINRFDVKVDRKEWRSVTQQCHILSENVEACFRDWGGFLDSLLFQEALVWLNGGENRCIKRLPITREGIEMGHHRVAMHDSNIGFTVTSFEDIEAHKKQLRSLLDYLPMEAWQLINIRGDKLSLATLSK
jgi:GxxExxY protein